MKQMVLAGFVLCVGFCGLSGSAKDVVAAAPAGVGEKKQEVKYTPEQIAARDERVLKKTGGILDVPPSGPAIFLVDARKKPGVEAEKVGKRFEEVAKLPVRWQTKNLGKQTALDFALEGVAKPGVAMVIVVAEEGHLPALTLYPEERVSIINADKLKEKATDEVYGIRVTKELWRSIGLLGGAGYSQGENCVLQPIFNLADLDAETFQVMQPMYFAKMAKVFNKLGVRRGTKIPYRLAVKQGWANQPTNEYQKAVWDEVKAEKKTESK